MEAGNEKLMVRPRVHHQVVKSLATEIMRGTFPTGAQLPPEQELCERFNVSRSTLREAVRVLASKGLLAPRPRTGTTVRAREHWALLDPEVLRWSMELEPNSAFVLDLIEARQVIEPAAARLAAIRASEDDIADMQSAFLRMGEAKARLDFPAFNEADLAFHRALLRASHNVVFQQLATTMGTALAYAFRMTTERSREPGASLPNHGEVVSRIRARDPAGAFASMSRLLDIAIIDLGLSR